MSSVDYDERLLSMVLENWPTLRISYFNKRSTVVADKWKEIDEALGPRSFNRFARIHFRYLEVKSISANPKVAQLVQQFQQLIKEAETKRETEELKFALSLADVCGGRRLTRQVIISVAERLQNVNEFVQNSGDIYHTVKNAMRIDQQIRYSRAEILFLHLQTRAIPFNANAYPSDDLTNKWLTALRRPISKIKATVLVPSMTSMKIAKHRPGNRGRQPRTKKQPARPANNGLAEKRKKEDVVRLLTVDIKPKSMPAFSVPERQGVEREQDQEPLVLTAKLEGEVPLVNEGEVVKILETLKENNLNVSRVDSNEVGIDKKADDAENATENSVLDNSSSAMETSAHSTAYDNPFDRTLERMTEKEAFGSCYSEVQEAKLLLEKSDWKSKKAAAAKLSTVFKRLNEEIVNSTEDETKSNREMGVEMLRELHSKHFDEV